MDITTKRSPVAFFSLQEIPSSYLDGEKPGVSDVGYAAG
jgi:hypothetical protein